MYVIYLVDVPGLREAFRLVATKPVVYRTYVGISFPRAHGLSTAVGC